MLHGKATCKLNIQPKGKKVTQPFVKNRVTQVILLNRNGEFTAARTIKLYKRMKKLIAILIFMAAVIGCQRDEFENEPINMPTGIDWAKTWYETNYPAKINLKSGDMAGNEKNLNTDWKSAIKSGNEKYEVVTVNLLTDRVFGFTTQESKKAWIESGEIKYIQSVSRLVILKEKTTQKTIGFIMTMMGDKNYLEEKEFKLQENNNYLKKDHNFSGMVLYHAMDGSFVNGWKFTEGKVTHKVHLSEDSDMGIRLKSIIICTTEYIEGWEIVERDASAGIPGSESYQGTTCEIIYYSIPITVCQDWGFSGGGGGDSSDGEEGGYEFPDAGGGGDSNPPTDEPQPCNCTNTCPVCGGCLDLAWLKSANTDCPACSCPAVPVVYDYDLRQNEKVFCIYEKMMNGGIMQRFIERYFGPSQPNHSFLGELNLSWTLGDYTGTMPIGGTDGYYVEITLNSNAANSMSATNVALSMLHEALHAKLIAEYYDHPEVTSTDFKNLYAHYNGWDNMDVTQEQQMLDKYSEQMAQALMDFDQTQGINHDLEFYIEAIKYTMYDEWGKSYTSGENEYSELFYSTKICH